MPPAHHRLVRLPVEHPGPRTLPALWQAPVTAAIAATEATYTLGPSTLHSMREAHQLADRLATHLSKMDLATALKARSRRYLRTHPTPETSYQASFWSRHVAQISYDGRQFRHGVFPPQLPPWPRQRRWQWLEVPDGLSPQN